MLTAIVLAVAAAAPAFPPPGVYTYVATLAGQPVGRWTLAVKRNAAGAEVDESSAASFAGIALSANAALRLGADLAPTSYEGNYHSATANPSVKVAFTATTATITGSLGGGAQSTAQSVALAPETRHFVVIEPGLAAGLFALPAQLAAWEDAAVTWISPIEGADHILPREPAVAAIRPSNVPAADVALSLGGQVPAMIWYDPATLVPDQMSVPSQNAVLTRVK